MAYNPNDYYYRKAKKNNFAARSIFKLEEIDARFKVIKPAQLVLDLGAAPGSWSQYVSKKLGPKGRVLGIDIQPIKLSMSNAAFITADLRELDLTQTFQDLEITPPFDVVLSDMAPKTIGIRVTDQTRSLELCELALDVASDYLKKGGNFICKLFHSEGFEVLRGRIRSSFTKIEILRPKSTRQQSKEIYLIGIGYKFEPLKISLNLK